MKTCIERETVFLYPSLSELDRKQVLITNELITNVNLIVRAANDSIKEILSQGSFAYINCFPTVLMRSVSEDSTIRIDNNKARICILKYNDIDYSDNYESLINDYRSGRSDISHLVAVALYDREQKPQFDVDSLGHFDVIIKTSIERLQHVLIAIMLDISLYHYFLQSDALNDRKDFNRKKLEYIFANDELFSQYGIKNKKDVPTYLPISWKNILKYERLRTKESRQEHVSTLIDDYANFLLNSIAYNVTFNENGRIANSSYDPLIKNFDLIQEFVEKTYCDSHAKKISFIVPDNATTIDQINMIKYNDDAPDSIESWMNKKVENIGAYQIIIAHERI